jgi:hypothetical protein
LGGFSASLLLWLVELLAVGFNGLRTVLRTRVSWLVTSRRVSVVVEVVTFRLRPDVDLFSCSVGDSAAEAGLLFFWRCEADILRSARLAARDGGREAIVIDSVPYVLAELLILGDGHLLISSDVSSPRARGKDTRARLPCIFEFSLARKRPKSLFLAWQQRQLHLPEQREKQKHLLP